MTELRPYQLRAIESARDARRAGHRRILLSAPTGAGKTRIAVSIISSALGFGQKILVIAHRRELLDQFWGALYTEGIGCVGLMRADDERTDPSQPVQIASISTLVRRDLPAADLVIVDEAHRTPSESYARILAQYPDATVIGLTATPCRLDGAPLKDHYDVLVQVASYSELIDQGFILAPIVYAPRQAPDLSNIRRIAGDYHEGQLEKAMLRPHVVGDVLAEWRDKAGGRQTVIFAVSIAHSLEIARRFQADGVSCAHLDGTTSADNRLGILMALETGRIQVVSNVGVLCEGWDQPRVKCCVMARPTLSLTLHMQCVGRILRPWGGLPPVVLDHAGNVERHGLPHEDRVWSLDGRVIRKTTSPYRTCPACYAYASKNPCEHCGHQASGKPRELRTAAGSLEAVTASPGAVQDARRAFYDKQVERARHQGFKPGFAGARFKEKFGEWPPWAWSQATKADFAKDEAWQAELVQRERKRALWAGRSEARIAELEALPEAVSEPETFSVDDL